MKFEKCLVCSNKTIKYLTNLFDDRYGAKGKHDVYVCTNCGFGRAYPGIKKKDIGEFYKKHYPLDIFKKRNLKLNSKKKSNFYYWITGKNNKPHQYIEKGSCVLDVGSGVGLSLLEIENMGAEAYGVEPDPNAQDFARKYKLNVYQGFLTDNPFPKIKFDYITASQVIEHEPDIHKFLEFAHKKLKDNGSLIITFPNFDSPLRKKLKRKWIHWHIPYHINFFTKKSVELLAEKYGFSVHKYKTITPNLWLFLQIRSLTQKVKEGGVNPIWRKEVNESYTNNTVCSLLKRKIKSMFEYSFYIPSVIIYKLLDIMGFGESVLVVLKKEQ